MNPKRSKDKWRPSNFGTLNMSFDGALKENPGPIGYSKALSRIKMVHLLWCL